MQAKYPKTFKPTYWDPVHMRYPVQKFPETCKSSEQIARVPRSVPETLKPLKTTPSEVRYYHTDHNVRRDLVRSQTAKDYSYKIPENKVINKHTSCISNEYIYPPNKNLSDRVPLINAHGATEARSAYKKPILDSRLVTDKDQFKIHYYPTTSHEPIFAKEIEPLYTTYEGFEKYLDPYLTTSRLHHRPFTAAQTNKQSNKRDVITYYTYSKTPWVRSQKPSVDEWKFPLSLSKSIYDREKFKQGFREIRTHNKLIWVPGTFRTEVRDNYVSKSCQLESKIHSNEDKIKTLRSKTIAGFKTNCIEDDYSIKLNYDTENSRLGSGKPLCRVFDPYVDKNKRLDNIHSKKQK